MNQKELQDRIQTCKKELVTQDKIVGISSIAILVAPLILFRYMNKLPEYGKFIVLFVIIVLLVVLCSYGFVSRKKTKKKYGLFCSGCQAYLGGKNAKISIESGKCAECGHIIYKSKEEQK